MHCGAGCPVRASPDARLTPGGCFLRHVVDAGLLVPRALMSNRQVNILAVHSGRESPTQWAPKEQTPPPISQAVYRPEQATLERQAVQACADGESRARGEALRHR